MKTAVVIPTQRRAAYLDVALGSVAAQAREQGADLIVVDDGPDEETRATAARHGATYIRHDAPRGLNAARNTGLDSTDAGLICFLDDDVRVDPGWLRALTAAAEQQPEEVGCFTGPIRGRIEGHRYPQCGRENPPITHLDLGPEDTDAPHAWGANLTVRRSAVERAGRFAEHHQLYGDEQEWQDRLKATGGRIRYVAAAGLDHRRAGDDARLRHLMGAALRRGRAARREDVAKGHIPSAAAEVKTLLRTLLHGPRFRCFNGPVMAAHQYGRLQEALRPTLPPATPQEDDFLSGRSGTFGGRRAALLSLQDAVLDVRDRPRAARLAHRARQRTPMRILVLSVARPGSRFPAARAELERSRHHLTIATSDVNGRGKFANLNALLAEHDLSTFDWVLVLDDDVTLPRHFLDAFIHEAGPYALAQPAHRRRSHAAWPHTRRPLSLTGPPARDTTFVEIGPVTAFGRQSFATLLPFPESLQMGWGLDAHWAALLRDEGRRLGIVDAVPIGHTDAPAADAYSRDTAIAEARQFLKDRPYVTRDEVR